MSEENLQELEVSERTAKKASTKKKKRSKHPRKDNPSSGNRPYPRIPLEKVIAVAKAIKEKNGGNSWPAQEIAKVLEVSAKGVGFAYSLFSSKKFGLTEGTSANSQVSLTDLGRELVYSGNPEEELHAKRAAFLKVPIFKDVLELYKGNKLPEMQYLGNTLESKFKLRPELHQEFSNLFKQNSEFVGLDSGVESTEVLGTTKRTHEQHTSEVIVLGEPKTKTGRVCFVIIPFSEKSGIYSLGFFSEVLNSLIIPAAREAGFEVKTANRQGTEMIHSTIVNEIIDADLCLCDLTEHNPNVLFELGMRLGHDKPVALIQAEGTARVFDVDNVLRVFPYKKELWRTTIQKDLPDLTAHIRATWEGRDAGESYYKLLRRAGVDKKLNAEAV
jgi:hypothetical protein